MSIGPVRSVSIRDAREARVNTWVLTVNVKLALKTHFITRHQRNVKESTALSIPTPQRMDFANQMFAPLDKSSSLMEGASPAQWDGNQTSKEHYARRSCARPITICLMMADAFKMTAPRASSHMIKKENARCQDARQ